MSGDLGSVTVDCAGGVGYETCSRISHRLALEGLTLELINTPETSELNHKCGAEFVQKNRLPPTGAVLHSKRVAIFDGDADR